MSDTITFNDPDSRTRCLLVASGKGGVGKSSLSVNLSVALSQLGKSVALVDADVWGFSVPRMLGVTETPKALENKLLPPRAHGVSCVSMGFFAEEEQPVIWRGPMLHKALQQFLTDVLWDNLDFLVVDMPPGTGDISISLAQFLPRGEVYIVTTPQPVAQKVALRAAYMYKKVRLEIKGVIENMSWFLGDDNQRYEIFGSGGGQELANQLQVPLLAKVPLFVPLRESSDDGTPVVVSHPDSETAKIIGELAVEVDSLKPSRRYSSALTIAAE